MKMLARPLLVLGACCALVLAPAFPSGDATPQTGPATEKRFPPLKVPSGFKATLFACDPLVAYPSAVARGPRPGAIFVAVDYMTGLGTEIVRRDEIRLVEDTDGDGYADKATVYAAGFNSIQGLTAHDGTVYVMHAPLLTALRDTDGDGRLDQRRDLLTGLGLPPEQNPVRLHCANGVVFGHDGWLYLALGDHGCDVLRPEGDRLVLQGGGILRCRADGHDLHVFAKGLRNIYDVALDAELNVFVRDNENDGGEYKIRVCHSFFSADHGYPYLYYERPEEALPPLADFGLGSSAGGLCYLETAFPAEYRGNLFFCEWGRAVVRYRPEPAGSTFAPLREIDFATGAPNDPYGFKPTDLIVQRDGSLIVVDWADGQRPRRGRGRIYHIAPLGTAAATLPSANKEAGLERWLALLDTASYSERVEAQGALEQRGRDGITALQEALSRKRLGVWGRLHAVWILAHVEGSAAVPALFALAQTDPDSRVQAQAVRAMADLLDPVLSRHRLEAGPGDAEWAARLAELAPGRDPRVLLEVVLALGRLRWSEAPPWLRKNLTDPDPALAHAAMQTLRRSQNWLALLKLLDEPDGVPLRSLALRALAGQADPLVVDGLLARLRTEGDPARRLVYADLLTRVHRKPGPWVYWGYRPPPRPVPTVAWERTDAIEEALDRVLGNPDGLVRLEVLRRIQREQIPTRLPTLSRWLREERQPATVAALLDSLRVHASAASRAVLAELIGASEYSTTNRLPALALFTSGLDDSSQKQLVELASTLEDGPVLAEALRSIGKRPKLRASPLLLAKIRSRVAGVRAASVEALAELGVVEAGEPVRTLLADPDKQVRQAAAAAAGKLGVRSAIESLLLLAQDTDSAVRRASLHSMRVLRESRVVPLALGALADPETQVAALECIADLGGPAHTRAVVELARQTPSADILPLVMRSLSNWSNQEPARRKELEHTMAELQGLSGVLIRWQATGPLAGDAGASLIERLSATPQLPAQAEDSSAWQTAFATGTEARILLGRQPQQAADRLWLAQTEVHLPEPTAVQFLASSTGILRIWLNGQRVYQREEARAFQPDADRFEAVLQKGTNRLVVVVSPTKGNAEFHLRFRRKSSTAEHERLAQAALARSGNVERGQQLFFNAGKSQCIKCHQIGGQGERIGPELTGIGKRFARVYLIESILEPSRAIAPSFETLVVALKDGRVLIGTRAAEDAETLTLGDNQGLKHVVAKANIDERRVQPLSTMPEGLEKQLTTEEFVDLITFLVNQ